MLEMSSLLPVITVILTALAGTWVYGYQKRADRLANLTELRRQKYIEYLSALHKLAFHLNPETVKNFQELGLPLTAIASDSVILKIGEFTNYMHDTTIIPKDSKIFKPMIANIIIEMRRDCFENSSLTSENLVNLLPLR